MDFRERLVNVRQQRGLTQLDFAELMGVSLNSQKSYERGTTSPTVRYLYALSNAGIDIGYLLTGQQDDRFLVPEERELLALWSKAPQPFRQIALLALQIGLPHKVVNNINNSLNGSQIVFNGD